MHRRTLTHSAHPKRPNILVHTTTPCQTASTFRTPHGCLLNDQIARQPLQNLPERLTTSEPSSANSLYNQGWLPPFASLALLHSGSSPTCLPDPLLLKPPATARNPSHSLAVFLKTPSWP